MKRREFLRSCAFGGCALALGISFAEESNYTPAPADSHKAGIYYLREAEWYEKLDNKRVKCTLCPNECKVGDMERGFCGVRENRHGLYYTLVYGNPCTVVPDPIEKKPLFHYLPGSWALSLATAGCNFVCKFCQNWQISQARPEQTDNIDITPQRLVSLCQRAVRNPWTGGKTVCQSLAYTYTEPVVFYEYMYDSARLAREKGIGSVMISNGFIHPEPVEKLCEVLTAVKIDLKAITEKFYRDVCSGRLKPVLDCLKVLSKQKIWFEVVYLVIPTLNDSTREFAEVSRWIVGELGTDVPVHFTRFYPTYRLRNLPPTSHSSVEKAREIAMKEGLKFVYVGNVRAGHPGENTYCPECGNRVIHRIRYIVREINLKDGRCPRCRTPIPGVWKSPI